MSLIIPSALDSGASGLGSSLDRGHSVLRQDTLLRTVPLSTQVYKWVPANLMLRCNPAMD